MMKREILSFDDGWKFCYADDLHFQEPLNFMYVYYKSKSERGRGPADPAFHDRDWKRVTLPHDMVIDGKPDQSVSNTQGFLKRRNGWYRRAFKLDQSDAGKRITVVFDGVCTHAVVYVNGHLLHRNFCGYTSFAVDITDYVNLDERLNLIAVYVDNSDFEGWWYEGGGIYRHVRMIKTSDVSVDDWGTYVRTEHKEGQAACPEGNTGQWKIAVDTVIRNDSYRERSLILHTILIDSKGEEVVRTRQPAAVPERDKACVRAVLDVADPALWDIGHPVLYTVRSVLEEDDSILDEYETKTGFREIRFDSEKGFFLNGQHVKVKGVCCHEDHNNLGVAVPDRIKWERLRMLKSIGVNAYRCSHNPPSPEILQYCDELGILVMDENRWFDSSPEGLDQLRSMVVRDRNHPSVFMWSMANEEPLQACERGKRILSAMRSYMKKLDDTRPVMMAMHTGLFDGEASSVADILGINYNEETYEQVHAACPGVPMVIAEIGGLIDEMGIMRDGSGYDWSKVAPYDFIIGMFKWTGFVYRGETRGWPKLYSRSGIIDSTGEPKENTWFYKSMWDEEPFVKIWPRHWNFEQMSQDLVEVHVYTTGEEVELFLNGESLGRKTVRPFERPRFDVRWQPGELRAAAYRDGKMISEDRVFTTGHPAGIWLETDRTEVVADGTQVITVTAGVKDAEGQKVLWARNHLSFDIEGDASLLMTGNTDVYDDTSPRSKDRRLFNGTCKLILRTGTMPGRICIKAEGEGLCGCDVTIDALPGKRPPHVPEVPELDSLTYFSKME